MKCVAPLDNSITLLQLIDDLYEAQRFTGNTPLASLTFPELPLTVEQVLAAE